MNAPQQLVRATSTRVRTTSGGAVLLPIAFACFAVALMRGGPATLLAAAAISLLGVSLLTAWLHVRGLELESLSSVERTVGEGFALKVKVVSHAKRLPACAVTLHATKKGGKFGVLPFLAPGKAQCVELPHRFMTRGPQKHVRIQVGSAFPFGLIRCTRTFEVPGEFLGLPRSISPGDLQRLQSTKQPGASRLATRLAGDEELWAPREWRQGEGVRRVHWKLSAKQRRLIVNEFRDLEDGPLEVVLVTQVRGWHPGSRHRSFEQAVSVTAAICERALQSGREVHLRLLESPHSPEDPLQGRIGRVQALRALAYVRPSSGDPQEQADKEVRLAIANGQQIACVLAGGKAAGSQRTPRNANWIDVDTLQLEYTPDEVLS